MIGELITINKDLINAAGWTLLHSVWQISVVALIAAIFLRFNQGSANLRYNFLGIVLWLIPLLSILTFIYYYESKTIPEGSETQFYSNYSTIIYDTATNNSIYYTLNGVLSDAVKNYSTVIVTLWFIGVLILMLRFTGGLYYTGELRNKGLIRIDENVRSTVERFRNINGIQRKVKVFESILVKIPVTLGYLKPVILLPAGAIAGLPPSQLEAILAHEIAHIKRNDYLQNIINSVIEIVFFYHPAVWWLTDRINEERENCCDDIAVEITGDTAGLAHALAGINNSFNHPKHVLAMSGKQNHLLQRIRRICGINDVDRKFTYHNYGFLFIAVLAAGIAFSVNASVQIPDNLMKTSLSLSNNNLYQIEQVVSTQDTTKNKKKPAQAVKPQTENNVREKTQKMSEEDRAKLKAEMEKLSEEMKKLEAQMMELHKQLGTSLKVYDFKFDDKHLKFYTDSLAFKNFDFKFDYNMDSLRFKINDDIEKDLSILRIYKDKEKNDSAVAEIYSRARIMSENNMMRARAEAEKSRAHAEKLIMVEKEKSKAAQARAKAGKLEIKTHSEDIEKELRKDGLIKGSHFNFKIDNSGMYLDGVKQPDKVYKKYKKMMISGLDKSDKESEFNIVITR